MTKKMKLNNGERYKTTWTGEHYFLVADYDRARYYIVNRSTSFVEMKIKVATEAVATCIKMDYDMRAIVAGMFEENLRGMYQEPIGDAPSPKNSKTLYEESMAALKDHIPGEDPPTNKGGNTLH